MELDAIAAVAIGGTLLTGGYGFVIGSLLGVLVLGTISSLIKFNGTLNSGWTRIASGLLVLMFIVMQRVLTLGRTVRAERDGRYRRRRDDPTTRHARRRPRGPGVAPDGLARAQRPPARAPGHQERVREAIAELGYRRNAAARSLVTRRSERDRPAHAEDRSVRPDELDDRRRGRRPRGRLLRQPGERRRDRPRRRCGRRSSTSRTRRPRPSC